MSAEHQDRPALRIVRGDPSAEEVAALVTVLAAAAAAAPAGEAPPAATGSQWAPPGRLLRAPVSPSGWWASALPR